MRAVGRREAERLHLLLEVSDTGLGISEEDQARLFRPFSQVGSPALGQASGSGLGLYISRRLVHLMGGQISLRSELGNGSSLLGRVRSSADRASAQRVQRSAFRSCRGRGAERGKGALDLACGRPSVQSADPDHAIGKPWAPGDLHGRWRGSIRTLAGRRLRCRDYRRHDAADGWLRAGATDPVARGPWRSASLLGDSAYRQRREGCAGALPGCRHGPGPVQADYAPMRLARALNGESRSCLRASIRNESARLVAVLRAASGCIG